MANRIVSLLAGAFLAVGCGDSRPPVGDAGVTCGSSQIFKISGNRKIDLLFVVDDSPAMASMEAKLAEQLPTFMSALIDRQSNLAPNLHVAVVSSSLGGGAFTDVPGCEAGGPGDRGGRFNHPEGAGLFPGETFMRLNGVPLNFQKDAGAVFSCLAELGHAGCPYPQPLEAARRALTKAQDPADPDNAGFLRADAELAVVFITNEEDCSVPANSDLFDPRQTRLADPYGAPGPYRCAERGWLCDGAPPPHSVPGGVDQLAFDACVPAEGAGRLTPVSDFAAFFKGLKANPDNVMVSFIAGPEQPVVISQRLASAAGGIIENVPTVESSCTGTTGETATPGIRLTALADAFGANGIRLTACAPTLALILIGVTEQIRIKLAGPCLPGVLALTDAGDPNCQVTETHVDENGVETRWALPICDADWTVIPCWTVDPRSTVLCSQGQLLRVCREVGCASPRVPSGSADLEVSCQVACP